MLNGPAQKGLLQPYPATPGDVGGKPRLIWPSEFALRTGGGLWWVSGAGGEYAQSWWRYAATGTSWDRVLPPAGRFRGHGVLGEGRGANSDRGPSACHQEEHRASQGVCSVKSASRGVQERLQEEGGDGGLEYSNLYYSCCNRDNRRKEDAFALHYFPLMPCRKWMLARKNRNVVFKRNFKAINDNSMGDDMVACLAKRRPKHSTRENTVSYAKLEHSCECIPLRQGFFNVLRYPYVASPHVISQPYRAPILPLPEELGGSQRCCTAWRRGRGTLCAVSRDRAHCGGAALRGVSIARPLRDSLQATGIAPPPSGGGWGGGGAEIAPAATEVSL
ncbi:Protein of unknown function [Gryllus bimaculatus]|nr:Protein of unknown function [Gryllus bimaculatus]